MDNEKNKENGQEKLGPQEAKTEKPSQTPSTGDAEAAKSSYAKKDSDKFRGKKFRKARKRDASQDEYDQRIIDIARVTRVMAGGKRMRFRACVALGNKAGQIGVAVAKGADVTMAVTKAVNKAKKNMITVPLVNETIPHEILCKFGAAKILFKPSRKGRGVIAGGSVRIILDLAGVKNVTSKILGTNNKVNNAKCTIKALADLIKPAKKEKKEEKPAEGENTEEKNDKKEIKKENK